MVATTNNILLGLREARKAASVGGHDKLMLRLRRQVMTRDVTDRQVAFVSMAYLRRSIQ